MDDTTKPDFAAADRDAPLIAASKSGTYYDDERNLARAYLSSRAQLATVQAERDTERMRLAGCGVAAHGGTTDGMAPEYDSDSLQAVLRLRAELATLRETLVGEMRSAKRIEGSPDETESWLASTWNTALDCAINVIKGTK